MSVCNLPKSEVDYLIGLLQRDGRFVTGPAEREFTVHDLVVQFCAVFFAHYSQREVRSC